MYFSLDLLFIYSVEALLNGIFFHYFYLPDAVIRFQILRIRIEIQAFCWICILNQDFAELGSNPDPDLEFIT